MLDALFPTVFKSHGCKFRRDYHMGHIHGAFYIENRFIGLDSPNLISLGIDGIDASLVAEIDQIFYHPVADV